MSNLMEYALETDPLSAESKAVTTAQVGTKGKLQLTFRRVRGAASITYTVQASSDLINWKNVAVNPGAFGQDVTVTDAAPAKSTRRFLRLKVTALP